MIFGRQMPGAVVFFITYKCDSHCKMCSAWTKQNPDSELTLNEIDAIFKDPCLSENVRIINITGGEPTLRQDITDIIKILTRRCARLMRIDMPTNGFNSGNIIDQVEKILAILTPTEVKMAVTVSIDGVGDVHDNVRGVQGGFMKTVFTLRGLKDLREVYSNLSVTMNTTVSNYNYSALGEIVAFAKEENVSINFTPAALSEIGAESKLFFEQFSLDAGAKGEVISFLKRTSDSNGMDPRYVQFITEWLKTGMRKAGCNFRNRKVFLLEPDGEAYLCGNFKEMRLGNLKENSFSRVWAGAGRIPHNAWKLCLACASNCYKDEKL